MRFKQRKKQVYLLIAFLAVSFYINNYCLVYARNYKNNTLSDFNNKCQQLLKQGINYLNQKQYHQAIEKFKHAKKLKPFAFKPYNNLAAAHIYTNNPKIALKYLAEAEKNLPEKYPQKYIFYYNYGLSYYMLDQSQKAIKYYRLALDKKSNFTQAIFAIALSYQAMNQSRQALTTYHKAKKIAEQKKDISLAKKSQEKIDQIKKNLSPKILKSIEYFQKGSQYFHQKNVEKAISFLEKSVNLDSSYAQSYFRLGFVYLSANKLDKSSAAFNQAIYLDKSLIKAYLNLGAIYGKKGKPKKALDILNNALSIDSKNPKIIYNIAMVYLTMGKKIKAKQYLKRAETLCLQSNNYDLLEKIRKQL